MKKKGSDRQPKALPRLVELPFVAAWFVACERFLPNESYGSLTLFAVYFGFVMAGYVVINVGWEMGRNLLRRAPASAFLEIWLIAGTVGLAVWLLSWHLPSLVGLTLPSSLFIGTLALLACLLVRVLVRPRSDGG